MTNKLKQGQMLASLRAATVRAKHEYDHPDPERRSAQKDGEEKPDDVFFRVGNALLADPTLMNQQVFCALKKLDKQCFGRPVYHNTALLLLRNNPLEIANRAYQQAASPGKLHPWISLFVLALKHNNELNRPGQDLYGAGPALEASIDQLLGAMAGHLEELPKAWRDALPPRCLRQWNAHLAAHQLQEATPPAKAPLRTPRM